MKPRTTNKYSSLTLLGNSQATLPADPRDAKLETFVNPYPHRDYQIQIACPEFTSLCPVTGQPDFADIAIEYVADGRCVETKSLKLYLSSFRNSPLFNEEVINRILDDLVKVCQPRRMKVVGRFVPRGGLALTVVAEHEANKVKRKSAP